MSEQPGRETPDDQRPPDAEQPPAGESPEEQAESGPKEVPQDAWEARRELYSHAPAAFGGGLVGGNQTGVSGGWVGGDVVFGSKVENHYRSSPATHTSGDIPAPRLDHLAEVFAGYEELIEPLKERLRNERVLVLRAAPFTGRHSAALMLLRALDAVPVRALDPKTRPTALKDEVIGDSQGYLVSDLVTDRTTPLRDIDLWAVRDELKKRDTTGEKPAYLVVTVDLHAVLQGISPVKWEPPAPESVLRSHLHALVKDTDRERELLALKETREFLAHGAYQLREAAAFAKALAEHTAGDEGLSAVSGAMVREQVQEWFSDDDTELRDKAFLISLAAFDESAYSLTAELSDDLFAQFQQTEDANEGPRVGVFGTSISNRLRLARARQYPKEEYTEWGPVMQRMARFEEPRTAGEVLREVWTGHPSARPAVIRWLKRLAGDGRPLVRNRAALTAAVLIDADLPSAMALLVEHWANSDRFRTCLVAANALAMADTIGAPNIPRILQSWCATDQPDRLQWTAIRVYGLVGKKMPGTALEALVNAARGNDDAEFRKHIASSVALLLTDDSPQVRSTVLCDLVVLLTDEPSVRRLALHAFVLACTHTEEPLLLDWYTEAGAQGSSEDPRHLAFLWRAALSDRGTTDEALKALQSWVAAADGDAVAEGRLTALLQVLAMTVDDRKRLDHMLRTVGIRPGGDPPQVAGRLLTVL